MKKIDCILITGGHGFIGQNLVASLVTDFPIVVVDNLLKQVHPNLGKLHIDSRIDSYVGGIAEKKLWSALLLKYNPVIVIHLAAETSTGLSAIEMDTHTSANVDGMAVMLSAFVRHDCVPEKFLLASSRAVYGEGYWLDTDNKMVPGDRRRFKDLVAGDWNPRENDLEGPFLVTPTANNWKSSSKKPTSVYGLTKAFQEDLAILWAETNGVSLSILRFQNVYGPGQTPSNSYTGILGLFIRQAMQKIQLEVYESGGIVRDFVYISDVVKAINVSLSRKDSLSVADVGTGRSLTLLELANKISMHYQINAPLIVQTFRMGDVRSAFSEQSGWLDGWRPEISIEEGLSPTISYVENFFES